MDEISNESKLILEVITGTLITQEIIVKVFDKHGVLAKQDVIDSLKMVINELETNLPGNNAIIPIRLLMRRLEKQPADSAPSKEHLPDWFHGILDGGRSEGTDPSEDK